MLRFVIVAALANDMRTLSSELGPHLDRLCPAPRLYADANVPAGLVSFMRAVLKWDVFFVLEHDDLRRAKDAEHFRLAREMHRTLVSFDRDYFDDRRFPPHQSGGVIVLSAPNERALFKILRRIHQRLWGSARSSDGVGTDATLPLLGQKVHVHPDWE